MLHLRPHHGLCMANFVGRGYDEAFTQNMKKVAASLAKEPGQTVLLAEGEDVLCGKCPHNQGRCVTAEKVRRLDAASLAACGLSAGQEIAWDEFQRLVREQVFEKGRFDEICRPCKWYDFCSGIVLLRQGMEKKKQFSDEPAE